MIFQLEKSQIQIQKAVRDFVKGEFKKDIIDRLLEQHEFPQKIWSKACELGFVGIHYPEQYDGEGLSPFENVLVAEELCRGDASVGTCIAKAGWGAGMILRYGTETQKKTWLSKVTKGEVLSGLALYEPGLGSDVALCQSSAEKDGDAWIVNGTKSFVINGGPLTGVYIILCRTTPESVSVDQSFSTILIEADRPGITTVDVGHRLGAHLINVNEVRFDQVRVPLDNLIGTEGRGLAQINGYMNETRIFSAAQSLGIAQGAFDRSFAYVKKREQFGRKIVDFEITRQKLADMATKIEASRLLTYQGAWFLNQSEGIEKLSAMAKWYTARSAVEVCDEAIQLLGGYGYIQEYEVERFYRDAKVEDVLDGTEILQKNIIANDFVKGKLISFSKI